MNTTEQSRLDEAREQQVAWKKWGPYLSERQWGTVREDYNENGDAWNFFTHDHARSRAYRWGEDGIAGLSDDKQSMEAQSQARSSGNQQAQSAKSWQGSGESHSWGGSSVGGWGGSHSGGYSGGSRSGGGRR